MNQVWTRHHLLNVIRVSTVCEPAVPRDQFGESEPATKCDPGTERDPIVKSELRELIHTPRTSSVYLEPKMPPSNEPSRPLGRMGEQIYHFISSASF